MLGELNENQKEDLLKSQVLNRFGWLTGNVL